MKLSSAMLDWCVGLILLLGAQSALAQPGGLPTLNQESGRPQPLPLDQAFPFYVSEPTPGTWQVTWNPAPGHYLYRHAFAFSLQQGENAQPQPVSFTLPPGLDKSDQFFGDIQAYYDQVSAGLALPEEWPAGSQLWIEYQGCADWGFCYPPQRTRFTLP